LILLSVPTSTIGKRRLVWYFVFDLTRKETFTEMLKEHNNLLQEQIQGKITNIMILIGTKCDLLTVQQAETVSLDEILAIVSKYKFAKFFVTSCASEQIQENNNNSSRNSKCPIGSLKQYYATPNRCLSYACTDICKVLYDKLGFVAAETKKASKSCSVQ